MDIQEYIDELKARINYLENLNDNLRKEIRVQRKEIAQLKEEKRTILNQDLPPEYNSTLDII